MLLLKYVTSAESWGARVNFLTFIVNCRPSAVELVNSTFDPKDNESYVSI